MTLEIPEYFKYNEYRLGKYLKYPAKESLIWKIKTLYKKVKSFDTAKKMLLDCNIKTLIKFTEDHFHEVKYCKKRVLYLLILIKNIVDGEYNIGEEKINKIRRIIIRLSEIQGKKYKLRSSKDYDLYKDVLNTAEYIIMEDKYPHWTSVELSSLWIHIFLYKEKEDVYWNRKARTFIKVLSKS